MRTHKLLRERPRRAPPPDALRERGGVEDIAPAVGNRAFTAFVLRETSARTASAMRVSPRPHPELDRDAPAWAEDGQKPPPLKTSGEGSEAPAGLVMVTDSLWARASGQQTEGHPWDGPDELFASAYAVFLMNQKLLQKLIAHYAKADPSIEKLGKELLDLLKTVKDPKALKALKAPGEDDAKAAEAAIRKRESPPSNVKDRLGAILDPEKLPPETVSCPK